jgi:hypothetical protein
VTPDITLANSAWLKSYDNIGNSMNLFRGNPDNGISIGTNLMLSSLFFPCDMGVKWIGNIPVNTAVYGTEQSLGLGVDDKKILTVGSYADGAGGTYGDFIKVAGGQLNTAVSTKTADYSALVSDNFILANGASGTVTITLPNATTYPGLTITVKAISIANAVKVISAGGNIDGTAAATGITYAAQYETHTYCSDGTQWWIKNN